MRNRIRDVSITMYTRSYQRHLVVKKIAQLLHQSLSDATMAIKYLFKPLFVFCHENATNYLLFNPFDTDCGFLVPVK